ncbi:glycosyl hydrolase family 8 [Frigidibacter sp. MR17.14]|uniref:glycosyl hydrolase family 8 n=1 Tax=Frigidibacter sp. MR17.14 TaxID=3126509 RepID=UPI0030130F81
MTCPSTAALRRRTLLCLPALLALPAHLRAGTPPDVPWQAWRTGRLTSEGRVIDHEQQDASHSEGQAYGLLLAEAAGDLAAVEAIEAWTEANLMVRQDRLMGWRWLPDNAVHDWNTASDGDLLRAWGLVRAARRWDRADLLDRARGIAGDLAAICLRPDPRRPDAGARLLLPGARDFESPAGLLLNPSYLMPRAMREIATATGIAQWQAAADASLALLAEIAGQGLPPDWIGLGPQGFFPAPDRSDRAGYDALRVPLYLAWSGARDHPAVTAMTAGALSDDGTTAAVVRDRDGRWHESSTLPGYRAIPALVRCQPLPDFDPGQPYYPATLQALCDLAARDSADYCQG